MVIFNNKRMIGRCETLYFTYAAGDLRTVLQQLIKAVIAPINIEYTDNSYAHGCADCRNCANTPGQDRRRIVHVESAQMRKIREDI